MRSKDIKSKKTLIANPANTSARSSPNGCRILLRFQTSKLQKISTATQILALIASKNIRWDSAVIAREPEAEYKTYAATKAWQKHHRMRRRWDFDIVAVDCQASLSVGTGREAGRARGARGGGSRKIWC
jgi:hypothetical protein